MKCEHKCICSDILNKKTYLEYNYLSIKDIYLMNICSGGKLRNGKEGDILFNDAFNAFCLWLYGVEHMVKDHSDS